VQWNLLPGAVVMADFTCGWDKEFEAQRGKAGGPRRLHTPDLFCVYCATVLASPGLGHSRSYCWGVSSGRSL
jgi:hypothetical protein